MAVLNGELRREPAAEREADQPDFIEAERVEQIEIMHHIVVHVGHRRLVVGFAKSRMKWESMTRNFSAQGLRELQSVQIPAPCRNTSG